MVFYTKLLPIELWLMIYKFEHYSYFTLVNKQINSLTKKSKLDMQKMIDIQTRVLPDIVFPPKQLSYFILQNINPNRFFNKLIHLPIIWKNTVLPINGKPNIYGICIGSNVMNTLITNDKIFSSYTRSLRLRELNDFHENRTRSLTGQLPHMSVVNTDIGKSNTADCGFGGISGIYGGRPFSKCENNNIFTHKGFALHIKDVI